MVVVPVPLVAWTGIERLPPDMRRRVGLVALTPPGLPAGGGWDATVTTPPLPGDLRAAIFAAAAQARLRRAHADAVRPAH